MGIEFINRILDEEQVIHPSLWEYPEEKYNQVEQELALLRQNDEDVLPNLLERCKEMAQGSMASFILATAALIRYSENDAGMLELSEKSETAGKWNYSKFFALKALSYNKESNYALRRLITACEKLGDDDNLYKALKQLSHIDFDELDGLVRLAQHSEKENNIEDAVFYYKKAAQRAIRQHNYIIAKQMCDSLEPLLGDDKSYILVIADRVARNIGADRAAAILFDLIKDCSDIDFEIKILKQILSYQPDNEQARTQLIAAYRKKYAECTRLEECIQLSNIEKAYVPIKKAIETFESSIAFDIGSFVFHNTWGIGRIASISSDKMTVNFAKKPGHQMTNEMAFSSLHVLPKTHIMVLKSAVSRDRLTRKFSEDVRWGLLTLISSGYDTFKAMKAELVPSILDASQWTDFYTKAKEILKNDSMLCPDMKNSDTFVIRTTPITYEEKQYLLFRNESDFYQKIKLVREFLENDGETDSEFFSDMVKYFNDNLKRNTIDDRIVASYLFIEELRNKWQLSFIENNANLMQQDIINAIIADKGKLFTDIQDNEIKKSCIDMIAENSTEWDQHLTLLFPLFLNSYIPDVFEKKGCTDFVKNMMQSSVQVARHNPDVFLYLLRSYSSADWKAAGYKPVDMMFIQLDVLNATSKSIENKTNLTESRKAVKALTSSLFEGSNTPVYQFIEKGDEKALRNFYNILKSYNSIDKRLIIDMTHRIHDKFPDIVTDSASPSDVKKQKLIPKALLCTQASYNAKTAELDNIMNVEIPKNSKEIGWAREKGDLRENAEYQYAKDKQKLLNEAMNRLDDEISRSLVVKPEDIDDSQVGFGTKIVLTDNTNGEEIVFTILGPWESDPVNGVISFQSPMGKELMFMKEGETKEFEINGQSYNYTLKSITPVEI